MRPNQVWAHPSPSAFISMESKVRVLVVDDQARARASLKALLATEPRIEQVEEAANGQQAIDVMVEWKPDVVVMDVQLPESNGVQVTRELKAVAPQVRVIVLTLYPEYREAALAAGASEFLLKGGSSQQLLNAIVNA